MANLGLREKARAERRKPGSKRTFVNWLNALEPSIREEVVELLNDRSIDGAAVYRTLRHHPDVMCPFADAYVNKWRDGKYESP